MTTTKRFANSITARWDDESNTSNPGWVVDVDWHVARGFQCETFPASPEWYNAPSNANAKQIARDWAAWEGIEMYDEIRYCCRICGQSFISHEFLSHSDSICDGCYAES